MQTVEQIVKLLIEGDQDLNSRVITDLIRSHAGDRQRMIDLHERYKVSTAGVPVLQRYFQDTRKVNNRINNDFFSDIIDIKTGYFAGEPISYMLDKVAYQDEEGNLSPKYDKHGEVITTFEKVNNLSDLDAEAAKLAAICGQAGRLLYVDGEGRERVINVPGWECIFVDDGSILEPQYAMRYYSITENGEEKYKVEWYDDRNVTFYIGSPQGAFTQTGSQSHLFDGVPLLPLYNNEERQGDAEKVLALIDGYDNVISDINSEIEQFRLAYMAFYGYTPDEETLEAAKQTGAFGLDNDGKIEFITKQMQGDIIESHLERLESNIYRFSQTPNFADEAFAGSQSGEARKFKMLPFENKCMLAERKFTVSLDQMFKLLATAWNKKGIDIDPDHITYQFTRNFPLDLLYEAEANSKLKGLVSDKTRLAMLSFIDDPENELEQMDAERPVDLDNFDEGDEDEPVEES